MKTDRLKRRVPHTITAAAVIGGLCLGPATIFGRTSHPTGSPSPATTPVNAPTPTPIPPGSLRISVSLVRDTERIPGQDTVAWLPEIRARGQTTSHVRISQRQKQFEPRIAVVAVGSTVDFPNYDRVFHNVFSLSKPRSFDLGLYRRGKSKNVRFDKPGLIQVFCNIHPQMAAYLMVVDSRHYATADEDGMILLRGVLPGRHRVQGWNVRGGMWSQEALIRPGRVTEAAVELDISNWREKPHLNKYGKEYPPPDDEDFRY